MTSVLSRQNLHDFFLKNFSFESNFFFFGFLVLSSDRLSIYSPFNEHVTYGASETSEHKSLCELIPPSCILQECRGDKFGLMTYVATLRKSCPHLERRFFRFNIFYRRLFCECFFLNIGRF